MEQKSVISEDERLRLKCFVEGFVAALSTQEILDKSRLDELVNMMSLHLYINTNYSIDEKEIEVICKNTYKERRKYIKFYIDTYYRDNDEETQFMQLVRDTVSGADIVPLVRPGMYSLSKNPYLTEEDLRTIANRLVEVFPHHTFMLDRMRINPYTKAKIGEFRIIYNTHEIKVYEEEFVW